jgi:hypothetical protein
MRVHRLTAVAEDRPAGQDDPVHIVRVSECRGRRWAVSPALRTIYYLASLSPADVAQAIMEAVHALAEHDARPKLRLVRADERAS